LLIANYSRGDDITRVKLSADGRSVVKAEQLVGGFTNPLPLAQDPDGTIYVGEFGGNKVTALKPTQTAPQAGTWTTKQPRPEAVLDAGGTFSQNEQYDPKTDTWTILAPMPTPRHGAVAGTINGVVYVAGGGPKGGISFSQVNEAFALGSTPPPDTTAPAPVTGFRAAAGDRRVTLSWQNPPDQDFAATRILRSTQGYATDPAPSTSQGQIYQGTGTSYADGGLVNGKTYYCTALARDQAGNWSVAAKATARPVAPTPPDTIAPRISGLKPEPGSRVRDRTSTIRAVVRDGQSELVKSNIRLYVDGKRMVTFSYDRSRDLLIRTTNRLSYGKHQVRVVAVDRAKNRAAKNWSFSVVRR
jgi:hypothetical protein